MTRALLLLVALAACRDEAPRPAPAPAPLADAAAATASAARVQRFCEDTLASLRDCLDDDAFWDVMFTVYASQYPDDAAEPGARERWIGVMRDGVAGIHQAGEVAANCRATLEHNRWPTPAQIDRVDRARAASCGDFANAYAWMLFGEGVFHAPR